MGSSRLNRLSAGLAGFALASFSPAQVPVILRDTAPASSPSGFAAIEQLTVVGDRLVFSTFSFGVVAYDPETRKTDLVVQPNPLGGDFWIRIHGGDGAVVFVKSDFSEASPIWRTDGTLASTRMLLPYDLEESSLPVLLDDASEGILAGDRLLLRFYDPVEQMENVWATDGTVEGTFQVTDSASAYGTLGHGTRVGGAVVIPYPTQQWSTDFWWTDGTPEGSHLSAVLPVSAYGQGVPVLDGEAALFRCGSEAEGSGLCVVNEEAASFINLPGQVVSDLARGGDAGYFVHRINGIDALWRSDGTVEGTLALAMTAGMVFNPNLSDTSASLAGGIVLIATSSNTPENVWFAAGDGSALTPIALQCDWVAGCQGNFDGRLREAQAGVVFLRWDAIHGAELWTTDGTPEGTERLLDLAPGAEDGAYSDFTEEEDGHVYFVGTTPELGAELYATDGTPSGTRRLTDFAGARPFGNPSSIALAVLDGRAWFASGSQLFSVSPSSGFQRQESDWRRGSGFNYRYFLGRPEFVLFEQQCDMPPQNTRLWSTDGAPAGTREVAMPTAGCRDLLLDYGEPSPLGWNFIKRWPAAGNRYQLFRFDTTVAPPVQITSLGGAEPGYGASLGNRYLFSVSALGQPLELWSTDGEVGAEELVATLPANLRYTSRFTSFGGHVLFVAFDDTDGHVELYRTDGSAPGTFSLGAWESIANQSVFYLFQLVKYGDAGYFAAKDAEGWGLWKTGAAVEEATRVTPSGLQIDSSFGPVVLRGWLYFAAADGGLPDAAYRTNGLGHIVRLAELASMPGGGRQVATLGDEGLLITGSDSDHGVEIWVSDGTEAPLHLLRDIARGPRSSHPSGLVSARGKAYFAATDDVHGIELWETDGTEAGTRMVWDLAEGGFASSPQTLSVIGNDLYFTANLQRFGREPWVLHLDWPAGLIFSDDFESGTTAQWYPSTP